MLLAYIGIDKISFLQYEDDKKAKIKLLYHQRYKNDFLFTGKDTSYLGFKEIISQAINKLNVSDRDIRVIVESSKIEYKKITAKISYNKKIEKYIKRNILKDTKSEDYIFSYFVNKNINIKNRKEPRECYYSIISKQIYSELRVTFEEQGFRVLSIEPFLSVLADFFLEETFRQIKNENDNLILMRKNKFLYIFLYEDYKLACFEKHPIDYNYDKSTASISKNVDSVISKIELFVRNMDKADKRYNVIYFPLSDEKREMFKERLEKTINSELWDLKVPVILNDLTEKEFHKYIEVAALYKKTVNH